MKNKKLFAILTLVCFMMTLMPVAAFAADATTVQQTGVAIDTSAFVAVDGDQSVKTDKNVTFYFAANDKSGTTTNDALDFVVWAVDANGAVSSAMTLDGKGVAESTQFDNAYNVSGAKNDDKFTVNFARAGKYTVYAGVLKSTDNSLNAAQLIGGSKSNFSVITVSGTATDPEKTYRAELANVSSGISIIEDTGVVGADKSLGTVNITPNNVAETVTVEFTKYADGKYTKLNGKTVSIDTNSANIDVNKTSATTNILGQIKFDLSASREGDFKVYLDVDGVQFVLDVQVGNTAATYIENVKQPTAPQALYNNNVTVRFQVTDINNNIIKDASAKNPQGMKGIFGIDPKNDGLTTEKYVVFTQKPSASNLTNSDLTLKWNANKQTYDLVINGILDAEGTYTVKAILDNGAYATATWEVKKFETPVSLKLTYSAPTVELGGVLYKDELMYVDVNGVEKDATGKVVLAATGYAVQNFNTTNGTITAKSDEKYVGSTITVTATDSRYNLVTTTEVKVANEAKELKFASKTGEVNVNNLITVMVVDADGNRVAVGGNGTDAKAEISYVVLDKPEGAKVTVSTSGIDNNLTSAGSFKMNLTSNKIGNVTVQAVVKVTNRNTADKDKQYIYQAVTKYYNKDNEEVTSDVALDNKGSLKDGYTSKVVAEPIGYTGNNNTQQYVTKYYTGTQIFAIGNGSAGDVVVMSIGSHEIIVNDKKATIDAAPMIQNDRTFVPFRALAEAFGAEVAYDEATQAVTAKLNGVEVVMTIGSATYTVNGAEKTMDVAPFINSSRTMVPVRFAAEAFGIKVIPTYDQNGATADILFNL